MARQPMTIHSWFNNGGLAIADVVWIEGLGFCSHQPDLDRPAPGETYRMMDEQGNICFIAGNKMYDTTRKERISYWARTENLWKKT